MLRDEWMSSFPFFDLSFTFEASAELICLSPCSSALSCRRFHPRSARLLLAQMAERPQREGVGLGFKSPDEVEFFFNSEAILLRNPRRFFLGSFVLQDLSFISFSVLIH